MSTFAGPARAVVLLHGLYEATDDPFDDLLTIEQDLIDRGLNVLRFPWPRKFNAVLALTNPRRSFARELAEALDAYLRVQMHDALHGREWAVVAHSGGGSLCYRWLVDCASPHRCTAGRLDLPNGKRIAVHEPLQTPRDIAQAYPQRLVVIAAANDKTALPVDTLFPADLVHSRAVAQHLIPDAGHRDVCHRQLTRGLIRAYV